MRTSAVATRSQPLMQGAESTVGWGPALQIGGAHPQQSHVPTMACLRKIPTHPRRPSATNRGQEVTMGHKDDSMDGEKDLDREEIATKTAAARMKGRTSARTMRPPPGVESAPPEGCTMGKKNQSRSNQGSDYHVRNNGRLD